MKASILFIKSFLKKSKDGLIIISVFIFLGALLTNTYLILSQDYRENFLRYHDKLNAEHNIIVLASPDNVRLKQDADAYFAQSELVSEFESTGVFAVSGSCAYDGEMLETNFIGMRRSDADKKCVGKYEIYAEDESIDGVLLPYIFYAAKNYEIGDDFTVSSSAGAFKSKVRGFYVSAMNSSINCVMIALIYTDSVYDDTSRALNSDAVMYSIRLKDYNESAKYIADVSLDIQSVSAYAQTVFCNCYEDTYPARYVISTICTSLISCVSNISAVIAAVLVAFNISGYISDNIKMFGTLKALGYKSRQIILPFVAVFTADALVFAFLGIAGSYAVMPFINRILVTQVGIPYKIHLLTVPMLLTAAAYTLLCLAVSCAALHRMKKIRPVNAIRQTAKNEKKQKATLRNSHLPVDLAIPARACLYNVRQNIIIAVTVMLVSLLSVLSVVMLQNIIINDTDIAYMVFGEFCDSCIISDTEDCERLHEYLDADSRVENTLEYSVQHFVTGDSRTVVGKIVDSCENITNRNYCYRGRFPENTGEVALGGSYALRFGYEIGDTVEISYAGFTENLKICGFLQSADSLGHDIIMTNETFERFSEITYRTLYINLADGENIDAFNAELEEKFPGIYTSNKQSYLKSMENSYFGAIKAICTAVLAVSCAIVFLVLFVLNKSLLNRKMHDYGVMKALGYSSKRLVLQAVNTYLPVIIAAAGIGTYISCYIVNPLMTLFMSGIGIQKCMFEIPVGPVILCGTVIVLFSALCVRLISSGIKSVSVRKFLNRE